MFVYLGLLQLACLPVGPTDAEGGWLYFVFYDLWCGVIVQVRCICVVVLCDLFVGLLVRSD